jgi:hypothetical protein
VAWGSISSRAADLSRHVTSGGVKAARHHVLLDHHDMGGEIGDHPDDDPPDDFAGPPETGFVRPCRSSPPSP